MRNVWRLQPRLLPLLQAVSQQRQDVALTAFDEAHIRWAMRTGLGPLLFAVTQADPHAPASPFWPLLRGADLTARVLTAEHFEAMSEILDACRGLVDSVILLKGISIAEQYYPVPHYRPMRDIDFLVAEADLPTMESLLGKLGYFQPQKHPRSPGTTWHHGSPFFHARRGIWIEVHWRLFPSWSIFGTGPLFHPDHVATQLRPSTFQGRPVTRFSAELQLVYIAAHWYHQYNILNWYHQYNIVAVEGAMIAMVDVLYLLGSSKSTLRWEQILEGVHGSAAALPLSILLTYLQCRDLIAVDAEVLRELSRTQHSLDDSNRPLLHSLIDQYLVDGRAPGPILNVRTLSILWQRLLLPGPLWRTLLLLPWYLLPSRVGIRAWLAGLQTQRDSSNQ